MSILKIISHEELSKFGSTENLNGQVLSLIEQQKTTWEAAEKNYNALNQVQTRNFDFSHFKIEVQFNQGRIRSSAAKTDAKSIAERPCFLCVHNLPEKQKGLTFNGNYLILVNPYPIFSGHLTISKTEHIPQQILPHFSDMLDLSQNLPGFTVFYNGPKCGASAPDHFHFQGVIKNSLPIETEFNTLETHFSETLQHSQKIKIVAVEEYLRRFIAIISGDKNEVIQKFGLIYQNLIINPEEEPRMNILCSFDEEKWKMIIFPRDKQRPSHYFRTDEQQIIVSPAAVEMGGVLVMPREEDFKKITEKEIAEIYDEVTLSRDNFEKLKKSDN